MIDLRYSSLSASLPPEVESALVQALSAIHSYPDAAYADLKEALAQDAGLTPKNIAVGNGLDDVIDQLSRILPEPFWIPTPAFCEFARAAKRNGKEIRLVPCLKEGRMSTGPLQNADSGTVWLANPNNPTGGAYDKSELGGLFSKSRAIIVMDEAYFEFCQKELLPDALLHPNVLRLRTFSKAIGLPGIRLGYLMADEKWVKRFEENRPFFPLNSLAASAGKCLPALRKNAKLRVDQITKTRESFSARLRNAGYCVLLSQTNFVLVDTGSERKTKQMLDALGQGGVKLLPPWDEEFTALPDHYIRFVIGTEEEMGRVAQVLEEMRNEDGGMRPVRPS